jgi:ribosomal protein L21
MILMVEDSPDPYVINDDNLSEGYIKMDRVFLPQGVEVTLREVLKSSDDDFIEIDDDFFIVKGHRVYLNHLRQGKENIKYKKRKNILERIKLGIN